MKKGRINMYEIMIKDKKVTKTNNMFQLGLQTKTAEDIKITVAEQMVESLNEDIGIMLDCMTKTILEGLLDGRK